MSTESLYRISTDRALLDVALIHEFLSRESYWAQHIPLETVQRALGRSLCFGLYESPQQELQGEPQRELPRQVGFARVVTDGATFGYLADVFVIASHRGRGLGQRLMAAVMAHPDVQGLRRFMLATRDAHGLYRQFGFDAPKHPEVLMERHDPGIYPPPRRSD